MRLPWLLCLVSGLLTGACASSGTNFDQTRADQLQPGLSTREDAVKALGKPNNELFNTDSTVILTWMQTKSSAGGAGKSRHQSIMFHKDGRMVKLLTKGSTDVR